MGDSKSRELFQTIAGKEFKMKTNRVLKFTGLSVFLVLLLACASLPSEGATTSTATEVAQPTLTSTLTALPVNIVAITETPSAVSPSIGTVCDPSSMSVVLSDGSLYQIRIINNTMCLPNGIPTQLWIIPESGLTSAPVIFSLGENLEIAANFFLDGNLLIQWTNYNISTGPVIAAAVVPPGVCFVVVTPDGGTYNRILAQQGNSISVASC